MDCQLSHLLKMASPPILGLLKGFSGWSHPLSEQMKQKEVFLVVLEQVTSPSDCSAWKSWASLHCLKQINSPKAWCKTPMPTQVKVCFLKWSTKASYLFQWSQQSTGTVTHLDYNMET